MTKNAGIIFSLLLFCSMGALAEQVVAKGEPIALSRAGEYYLSPKWSPSGDQVAAGGPSYTGLYLLDFPTGNVQQLSSDYSAGWGFAWSHDGSRIASKISHFEKMRRKVTLVTFDVAEGTMESLTAPRSTWSGTPLWTENDAHLYLTHADKFESFSTTNEESTLRASHLNYVRDGKFHNRVTTNSSTNEIVQFQDQDRIYSYAISPDGEHVAYSTAGQNLWVAKVNGEDRISLGRGSVPAWSPDGEWITFMLSFDDGHSITGSDIHVIKRDGTYRNNLTKTPDIHEMNPQWSPEGIWIVFDTDAHGQLFVQQVEWR